MSLKKSKKEYRCYVTDEVIPAARVKYLLSEGVAEHMLTSLTGSTMVHKPRKILILDDESNFVICDRIDETRIYAAERFGKSAEVDDEETEEQIEAKTFKIITKEKEEEDEV